MKLTNQGTALLLVAIAAGLAVTACFHQATDARFGALLGFAGGISTGAFALIQGEKKNSDDSDPK